MTGPTTTTTTRAQQQPRTPDQIAAEEAEILDPDLTIHLSDGRAVTVREIRYTQARRLGAELRPFVEGIAKRTAQGKLDVAAIIQLPEDHPDLFARLLEASTGLTLADQDTLRDDDGPLLEVTFWRVNLGFFARRVARALPENLGALAAWVGEDVGIAEAVAEAVKAAVAMPTTPTSSPVNTSSSSPSTDTTPSA